MSQSRLSSFYEAAMNILIGFSINFVANLLVFPHFGFNVTIADNFMLGGIYTVISLVRSYVIRRWFNARLHAAAERLAT